MPGAISLAPLYDVVVVLVEQVVRAHGNPASTEKGQYLDRVVGFDIMADELGHPFIPFHLDVFRAIRRVKEKVSGCTFGFRVHCCEILPVPLGDISNPSALTSSDLDMERVRATHVRVVFQCVSGLFDPSYLNGEHWYQVSSVVSVVVARCIGVSPVRGRKGRMEREGPGGWGTGRVQ